MLKLYHHFVIRRFLLDTLQRCFKNPLFLTNRGGGSAGGTSLTELGIQLIEKFNKTDTEVKKVTSEFLKWLEENQRKSKL